MNKLFNKKKYMQRQIYNYPYHAEQQLRDGWMVKCFCYRENSNRLFDYIIKIIDPRGLEITRMNLEKYETCNIREEMKKIYKNLKEDAGYTYYGERHMNWESDIGSLVLVSFEVILELYTWIESQLYEVSNLLINKIYCEEENRFDKEISEEYMNNPASVSLLSGDRKPQIRF